MAKHENLTTLFTAIADSIRNKTGGTDPIVADDFPEAIDGIQTGGGVDKIQRWIELNGNSAKYLFYYFTGESVDELMDGVDTSKVTNMNSMFGYSKVTSVPLFDTRNVTDMGNMFSGCAGLTEVPLFNTSNVTDMQYMFSSCKNLTTVPLFDTSNVTAFRRLFDGCSKLTSVPLFNTNKVTSMDTVFQNCKELTVVPLFNTSKVTGMYSMFCDCAKLLVIPAFDMRNCTSISAMASGCKALTECWVRNIKTNFTVGSGTSYGHLLTLESLLHLCKECRKTTSSLKLTVGTANLAKLEGVYVKLIDITDEMRAEDDLIDEKYPFVQCESTDDGAMSLADYMATKMWSLA